MEAKPRELRFHEGLARLEEIVRRLEADDLELEDALDRYEEGLGLYRQLTDVLAQAEKRVELLAGERAGKLLWDSFSPEAASGPPDGGGPRD